MEGKFGTSKEDTGKGVHLIGSYPCVFVSIHERLNLIKLIITKSVE